MSRYIAATEHYFDALLQIDSKLAPIYGEINDIDPCAGISYGRHQAYIIPAGEDSIILGREELIQKAQLELDVWRDYCLVHVWLSNRIYMLCPDYAQWGVTPGNRTVDIVTQNGVIVSFTANQVAAAMSKCSEVEWTYEAIMDEMENAPKITRQKRTRRLRKKLYVGEFSVYGFELSGRLKVASEAELHSFSDGLIDLLESRRLCMGGNLGENFSVMVGGHGRYDSANSGDLRVVREWLECNKACLSFAIGPLIDLNK